MTSLNATGPAGVLAICGHQRGRTLGERIVLRLAHRLAGFLPAFGQERHHAGDAEQLVAVHPHRLRRETEAGDRIGGQRLLLLAVGDFQRRKLLDRAAAGRQQVDRMVRRLHHRVDDGIEGIDRAAERDIDEVGRGLARAVIDRAGEGVCTVLDLVALGRVALRGLAAHDDAGQRAVGREAVLLVDLADEAAQVEAEARPVRAVGRRPHRHLAVARGAVAGGKRPDFRVFGRLGELVDRRLGESLGRGERRAGEQNASDHELSPQCVGHISVWRGLTSMPITKILARFAKPSPFVPRQARDEGLRVRDCAVLTFLHPELVRLRQGYGGQGE